MTKMKYRDYLMALLLAAVLVGGGPLACKNEPPGKDATAPAADRADTAPPAASTDAGRADAAGVGTTASGETPADGEMPADGKTPANNKTPADGKTPADRDAAVSPAKAGAIHWYDYKEGMSLAKNRKKKVFLNFYADWCRYCKDMDRNTFRDQKVIAYLSDNFVPVRVNSDRDPQTAARYQVRGLPVSWFISEDGEPIGSQPGYVPPESLLPLLKFINTDAYTRMGFDEFIKTM